MEAWSYKACRHAGIEVWSLGGLKLWMYRYKNMEARRHVGIDICKYGSMEA